VPASRLVKIGMYRGREGSFHLLFPENLKQHSKKPVDGPEDSDVGLSYGRVQPVHSNSLICKTITSTNKKKPNIVSVCERNS